MPGLEPWVKISRSGDSFIYLSGYATESQDILSDTGNANNFEEVSARAKEFLEREKWRSKK